MQMLAQIVPDPKRIVRAQPCVDADEMRVEVERPGNPVHVKHRGAFPGADLGDELRAMPLEDVLEDRMVRMPALRVYGKAWISIAVATSVDADASKGPVGRLSSRGNLNVGHPHGL